MATPAFGMVGGSNNGAPMPIFGNTNPTGGNFNFGGSPSGGSSPSFSLFGGGSSPLFNGGGSYSTTNMSGMGSGFGLLPGGQQFGPTTYNDLGKAYGKGFGQYLGDIFSQGLFNPNVAQQYINFMQPQVNRGQANLLQSFGAEGSRFGSAAALGLGDYLSQVNLNEGDIFANMFQTAQQEQLSLLQSILPTLHSEKANQGGTMQDILGGIGMAASIGLAPFTGGASLMGLGPSMGMLNSGLSGGGGGGGGGSMSGGGMMGGMNMGGFSGGFGMTPWMNTGTFGNNAPSVDPQAWIANEISGSAGDMLTGGAGLPFMP